MKLVLADGELGLVPLAVTPGGKPGAVLLHRSGLLDALEALFETVWRGAHPLELSSVDGAPEPTFNLDVEGPTDLDRKIIALLLAGLADQTVVRGSPAYLNRRSSGALAIKAMVTGRGQR